MTFIVVVLGIILWFAVGIVSIILTLKLCVKAFPDARRDMDEMTNPGLIIAFASFWPLSTGILFFVCSITHAKDSPWHTKIVNWIKK